MDHRIYLWVYAGVCVHVSVCFCTVYYRKVKLDLDFYFYVQNRNNSTRNKRCIGLPYSSIACMDLSCFPQLCVMSDGFCFSHPTPLLPPHTRVYYAPFWLLSECVWHTVQATTVQQHFPVFGFFVPIVANQAQLEKNRQQTTENLSFIGVKVWGQCKLSSCTRTSTSSEH